MPALGAISLFPVTWPAHPPAPRHGCHTSYSSNCSLASDSWGPSLPPKPAAACHLWHVLLLHLLQDFSLSFKPSLVSLLLLCGAFPSSSFLDQHTWPRSLHPFGLHLACQDHMQHPCSVGWTRLFTLKRETTNMPVCSVLSNSLRPHGL